jgi:predicted Mrr-cat superfamily restriction endonuclease
LLFAGGEASPAPTSVPLLPDDDPRVRQSIVWVAPLAQRLIRLLHQGHTWNEISHRAFEEIVAELFDGFGYKVELTKRTRDGGRDVIAIRHSIIKDDKYLIECKHGEDKAGVRVVRELLGVGVDDPNSGLILASTSGFTHDAKILVAREHVRWILALKDRDDLDAWIENYARLKGWLA